MKTKIWKRINLRIRLIENKNTGNFQVELRDKNYGGWSILATFSSFKEGLKKKHEHINIFTLRGFGHRNELAYRRLKRNKKNNNNNLSTHQKKSYI